MKKPLLLVLVWCVCVSSGFAANAQKIHPVDSPVYHALTLLYISNGYAVPSTGGPWSTDELSRMLHKIDRSRLSESGKKSYDYVSDALDEGDDSFRFGLDLALEGYYHADEHNFVREEDWVRGSDERKPLADVVLETWITDHAYGYSSFSFAGRRFHEHDLDEGLTSAYYGVLPFTTNLFFLYAHGIGDLDLGMPYRAFGALGGKGWSVQAGRDRLSWGPGVTGNFMLGDHLKYHDTGRVTFYADKIKYTMATSFFAHPIQYYPIMETDPLDPDYGKFINRRSQDQPSEGLRMFLGHRLEWRMFADKVGFALSEAIMYQTAVDPVTGLLKDTALDLRVLNPSMIYHNLYIRSNANSLLTLEMDYSPIKHLNIYGQVAIDEFTLPGEGVAGIDDNIRPSAYGFMAGMKTAIPLGTGMLYGSFEGAKTDPYLYLRDNGDRRQDPGEFGVNWVVAHREYAGASTHMALAYVEEFIGYQYGPDAIVLNGNVGFREYGKWYAEGNIFYMFHGTHDKWTLFSQFDNGDGVNDDDPVYVDAPTPTKTHVTGNNGDVDVSDRVAVSRTLVVGLKGGYVILPGLEIYAQGDFIHMANPGNRDTRAIQDIQLSFGVSCSL